MPWLPALTLLAAANAILLVAIAVAPIARRLGLRTWKMRHARIVARVRRQLDRPDGGSRVETFLHGADEAAVLEVLGAIGRAPAQYSAALEPVARLVSESAPRVRVSASWACLEILEARPDTQEVLRRDPSPDVRALVVHAATLDRARPLSPTARQIVLGAMEDPDPVVRLAAVSGLARATTSTAHASTYADMASALVQRSSDPVPEIRVAAVRLIGCYGVGGDVALCRMLSGMDPLTSRALLASVSRRDQPPRPEVLTIATDSHADHRASAIRMLGTTSDPRARRALTLLLGDRDSRVRHESATAAASSARIGYPEPLDPVLVDRLLQRLAEETVQGIVAEVIDALAHSLDPRVPAAFLGRIPASGGSLRERLVESGALFAHLLQSAQRRAQEVGA